MKTPFVVQCVPTAFASAPFIVGHYYIVDDDDGTVYFIRGYFGGWMTIRFTKIDKLTTRWCKVITMQNKIQHKRDQCQK